MCGRYATTRSTAELSVIFEAADETDDLLAPDYNVAPTDPAPIVRITPEPRAGATAGRVLSVARWGLTPHWADDARSAARMINARAETVAEAPAFRASFAARRCLVPADGWYEWPAPGRPVFLTPTTDEPLVFAGLWAANAAVPGRLSCAVVTIGAVGALARVHDRMPLLLPRQRWADWLTAEDASGLLTPPTAEWLSTVEIRPVGRAVGDVRNDGPGLVERLAAPPPEAEQIGLF
ncbi:SOS response-associated peptidase [Pilimelia columellifera]|uniref:Abasic site processing protein n=1 Tax=Pilimelia columellifera subsp. columellifera TaxID=706583 RepID=A0ABN3N9C7_9ACTN